MFFSLAMTACVSLFAESSITDGEIRAQFEGGSIKVYDQKSEKLILTMKPDPAIQKPYAETIIFPTHKRTALLVRGEKGSSPFVGTIFFLLFPFLLPFCIVPRFDSRIVPIVSGRRGHSCFSLKSMPLSFLSIDNPSSIEYIIHTFSSKVFFKSER